MDFRLPRHECLRGFIRLWRAGRLDLEGMISQRLGLKEINKGFEDMKAGTVIRSVVEI